jgi:hypothetical protein
MKVLALFLFSIGLAKLGTSRAIAQGLDPDPIVDYCYAQNANYPSLLAACLTELGGFYVDPAFGDFCKNQNERYPSLWKSCFIENKNMRVKRGFQRFCRDQNERYPSLWKSCLRDNSTSYNPEKCL